MSWKVDWEGEMGDWRESRKVVEVGESRDWGKVVWARGETGGEISGAAERRCSVAVVSGCLTPFRPFCVFCELSSRCRYPARLVND